MKSIMKNKKCFYSKGFTLIEILVVVLIIGILAAVALPKYQLAVEKSRFMSMLPLTKALAEAEERYFLINGRFTTDFAALDIEAGPVVLNNTQGQRARNGKHIYGLINFKGTDRAGFAIASQNDYTLPTAPQDDSLFLTYVFSTGKFYCVAYYWDAKRLNFCEKAFGQKPATCPSVFSSNTRCTELKF
jgi:type IV pilus assembly protein PilE